MSDIYKTTIAAILIFAFVFPYGFLVFPKKAEAVVPVVETEGMLMDLTAIIAKASVISAKQNLEQTGLQTGILSQEISSGLYIKSLHQKEVGPTPFVPVGGWDQIANQITKIMIGMFTSSLVNWIQGAGMYPGGGSGSMFVSDIGGYLLSVADNAAGLYLEQILDPEIFNMLCSPFRIPLYNAIRNFALPTFPRALCTLSDIANNIQNFLGGGFLTAGYGGGYQAWNQLILPQNNFYGAYILSTEELLQKQIARTNTAQSELSFGQGFLSWKKMEKAGMEKKCKKWSEPYNYGKRDCKEWGEEVPYYKEVIKTPGKVVEDQLATTFGSSVRSLEVADEVNEIIAALIQRLITEILMGGRGVGGWNSASSPALREIEQTAQTARTPDLLVSGLSYSPLNPPAGKLMSFSGYVYDNSATTTSTMAELKIDTGNNDSWDVSTSTKINLSASGMGLANWRDVWRATVGTHKFRICADPGNSIAELNENNNCDEDIFVVPDTPQLLADLITETVSFTPSNPGPGDLMTFKGTVKNIGSVGISESSRTRLRIGVDSGGVSVWDVSQEAPTGPLFPGGAEEESWPNVWTATLGVHKFEVCADVSGAVEEEIESNNCLSRTFEVVKKPDLTVPSVSVSPQYPRLYDKITFSGVIRNSNDVFSTTSPPTYARLRIDLQGNDKWDVTLEYQPTGSLLPGGQKTETWWWLASMPGTHIFEICADATDLAGELNEQNNCRSGSFTVSSSPQQY